MRITWLLLAGLLATPAGAGESLRCGNDLITSGDALARVQRLCGAPVDVQHSVAWREPGYWIAGRPVYAAGGWREVPVEIWTYNFGPNTFMRRVHFEDGVVTAIEVLGYGYLGPGGH
ncbi:MAG: DUF2845 domain-containing protein [Gammaproteobacteria bacterium]|nr:DUF2845 domain-containing protein [Gammaproteobacteria bacterium]